MQAALAVGPVPGRIDDHARRIARPAIPRRAAMSEKVGEMARESADYRCERCHTITRITKGELIRPCAQCGYDTYDLSNPRFERKDGSLGPHEPG